MIVGSNSYISDDRFPSVTIIVINYNGGQYVLKCIQRLLQTDYENYRVIVLDNASNDSSVDDIREAFPNVEIIRLDTNAGYAGGTNYVIDLLQDKYIVILNNDIYVDHDWLRKLIKTAEANPKAIMIGPRVLNSIDRTTSFAGAYITFPIIGSHIVGAQGLEKEYSGVVESSYAAGALFLIKRYEALSIGSFDSDYFLNWEEIDFAWRAWLCGYQVLMNLDACVYHDGGKATKGTLTSRRQSFFGHKNRIMTYHKYLSYRLLFIGLIGEMMYAYLFLQRSLFSNDIEAHCRFQGYLLAIMWILKNLRLVYRKRLIMKRRCKYWGLLPPHTKATKVQLIDLSKNTFI